MVDNDRECHGFSHVQNIQNMKINESVFFKKKREIEKISVWGMIRGKR